MTKQALNIYYASYFGWEKKYLQINISQIYIMPHILGRKISISNRYMQLIFWIGNNISTNDQTLGTWPALYIE